MRDSPGHDGTVPVPDELHDQVLRLWGNVDAQAESLAHNQYLTADVWRVTAGTDRAIVKRLRRPTGGQGSAWDQHWTAGSSTESHWNFWEREVRSYESGLVDVFAPDGIRGPRCLAVERSADHISLWLEEAAGLPGERWDLSRYAQAAEALGAAQARLTAADLRPSFPWLSQNYLADYSREKPVDWSLLTSDEAWSLPLVRDNVPGELQRVTNLLHDSRDALYAIARRLPRTLCHLDFWSKNLFADADEILLIDWAFVGEGALGEDIGNLVLDAVFDHFVPVAQLAELDALVFDAYVGGLRRGGWIGDKRIVRLGMCSLAVKYDWLTPFMLASATADRHLAYGEMVEVDAAHRYRERGTALLYACGWARDALALAEQLGI